ncbi:hypothetical protein [Spiroplasma endosymbiont of Polydrusus pterygomalis]|uniref:hypothetical protein n=1 Tax=Spiroplasma endosymbiont of Polydrusus pterygomalis TaxID=3139327 RepID=UPI003CCA9EE3
MVSTNLIEHHPITFIITALGDNFIEKLYNQTIKSIVGVQITEQPLSKVIKTTSIKKIKYRYSDEAQAIEIKKGLKKTNYSLYSSKINIKSIKKNLLLKSGSATSFSNDENIYTGKEIKIKFSFYYLFE